MRNGNSTYRIVLRRRRGDARLRAFVTCVRALYN